MKVVTYSPDHMLKNMYDTFTEFEIFSNFKNALKLTIFAKIAHNVAKSIYFPNI